MQTQLDAASTTRPVQAAEPRLAASDTCTSADNASTIAQSLQIDLSNTASSLAGVGRPGARSRAASQNIWIRHPPPNPLSQAHPTCPFPLRRAPRSLSPRSPSPPPPAARASPRVPLHRAERPIPAAFGYSDTDDASVPPAATAAPAPRTIVRRSGPSTTTSPRSAPLPGAARGVPAADGWTPTPRRRLRRCKHSRRARAR
ncbi:hypothetical protein DFH11DRAFT_900768 [Phellopilus nigrolimitatus]|nr:hypothetical protein DFH11DRAFT_900768 [Phellopilus nigrolimitatus]